MAFRCCRKHHSSNFFVTAIDMRQEHKSPFHSPTLHFLVHIPLCVWCLVQNCSRRCQHARSRCVRTAKRHGDRLCDRHVHHIVVLRDVYCFVIQCSIQPCRRGKLQHTPLHHARHTDFPTQLPAHYFFLLGNCTFGYPHCRRKLLHRPSSRTA